MLKKYRNTLLNFVRAANLDPRKLTPHEGEVRVGLSTFDGYDLTLEGSSITFFVAERFNNEREFNYAGIHCDITRKGPTPRPGTWYGWTSDFKNVEGGFEKWLSADAKKYFSYRAEEAEDASTADLWADLDLPPNSAADFQALPNTPFSSAEQVRIADTLNEFLKETQNRELLPAEELRELHEQVDYLIDASKRLGRKDWVMAATGALFSFTLQAGLTAGTASQLFHLASEGLQWIVVHMPLLNP